MFLRYTRILLAAIWGAVSSVLFFPVALMRPFHPNNSYLFWRMFAPVAAKILGIRYVVRGRQNIDLNNPCVVISNHQKNLDLVTCIMAITPRTLSVGKKSIFWIPFFGIYYCTSGNILSDRKHRARAMEAMDQVKHTILEKKANVWIMPEGTRNRTGVLKPFKKGAFVTAIHAQVPIVPVAISTYEGSIDLSRWKAGTIFVEVMPALVTIGMTPEDVESLSLKAREGILAKIQELDRQSC